MSEPTRRQVWRDAVRRATNDPIIDLYAFAVLMGLDDFMSADGVCWPGLHAISERARVKSTDTTKRRLERLAAVGWVTRSVGAGPRGSTVYSLPDLLPDGTVLPPPSHPMGRSLSHPMGRSPSHPVGRSLSVTLPPGGTEPSHPVAPTVPPGGSEPVEPVLNPWGAARAALYAARNGSRPGPAPPTPSASHQEAPTMTATLPDDLPSPEEDRAALDVLLAKLDAEELSTGTQLAELDQERVLSRVRRPVDWTEITEEHHELARQAAAMGLPPGRPEWIEITVAVVDPDGNPAGVEIVRSAGISNLPHPREEITYDG